MGKSCGLRAPPKCPVALYRQALALAPGLGRRDPGQEQASLPWGQLIAFLNQVPCWMVAWRRAVWGRDGVRGEARRERQKRRKETEAEAQREKEKE